LCFGDGQGLGVLADADLGITVRSARTLEPAEDPEDDRVAGRGPRQGQLVGGLDVPLGREHHPPAAGPANR
jgi:hypothetical protein